MKTAVLNFSGNTGKTTFARHCAAPRMGVNVIPVESINGDESESDAIRGKQFGELIEAVAVMDHALCDVGASNVETFLAKMREYAGSHEDFDYYVVPTVPKKKQISDTIATIEALSQIGVPANKIRVVFNMVEHDEDPNHLFSPLIEFHKAEKSFTFNKGAVIHVSDLFGKLNAGTHNIADILADDTDYKAMLRDTADANEKMRISRLIAIKRLAVGVTQELDGVYAALFPDARP